MFRITAAAVRKRVAVTRPFPKAKPDCWGVKPAGDGVNFSGPNVLGRLLMELRDRGQLDYSLPDDALGYIKILQNVCKNEES